ncbi:PSME3-interacting protein isoform X1 [Entelurus aequoreus]|uniref:PSME3-interacting protein isoform X1 n=1 Tax=Entelurus aequoreus TaxID=161455 RepID=UPI002B1DAB1B|nr:PSME3-interacting protein isoform X1 [Entelurus aequoreus]XP_061891809.1 PSME3-interacting protein isoform X1 [Entelurus aequoreus]
MAAEETGVELTRKFVSEAELDERRKKRQEEWEKVRKPDDPEKAPEEAYDSRSLFERLAEQRDKKQEEFEEQFKFKNMVRGLDDDETSFLDEVSRQQSLVEKQRRDEEKQELLEYRSAVAKQVPPDSRPEPEKKAAPKHSVLEQKTSHLSQAHLLVGAVKRRSSSQSSESSKKQKVENTATGNGDRHTEQEGGGGEGRSGGAESPARVPGLVPKNPSPPLNSSPGVLHLPSAAVCIGILPGLCNYSGSSDSDTSSDSEGSVDAVMSPYVKHRKAYR